MLITLSRLAFIAWLAQVEFGAMVLLGVLHEPSGKATQSSAVATINQTCRTRKPKNNMVQDKCSIMEEQDWQRE